MTLHVLPDIEQGSEAWHDQRRGMVTASVIGRLITSKTLAVASNDESRGLTALLAAERITGWTDPTFSNFDMIRGTEHEPIARDYYSGLYQQAVEVGYMVREEPMPWDPNELVRTVDEDTPTWRLGYSPDGLVGDDGLIEIKCPRAKTHLNTILADEVPSYNVAQCMAGLFVSGRKWLDFVSFCGGMPLFVKRVHPDPKWFEVIEAAVVRFEANVKQIAHDYRKATTGLPMTERVLELEMSL